MSKSRKNLFARFLSQTSVAKESPSMSRKSALRNAASCETLEGRVVLSGFGGGGGFMGGAPGMMGGGRFQGGPAMMGTASPQNGANTQDFQDAGGMMGGGPGMMGGGGSQGGPGMMGGGGLVASLAKVGVVSLAEGPDGPGGPNGQAPTGLASNAQFTQLQTDLQKVQTDLKAVTAKSGLTVADLTNLSADEQAIETAGARIDPKAMQKAVGEIANAIAGNTDATQAKADFNTLFKGTSVAQTAIDKAYSDISQAVTDSKVSTSDLTTIAADQTAVQTDFTKLQASGAVPGGPRGGGLTGSLANVGVISEAGGGGQMGRFGGGAGPRGRGFGGQAQIPQAPQIPAELQKLQTDTQAIAAKSGVTVAELTNLKADEQAIGTAGASLDRTALNKAVTDLATAITGSADTTASKTEFNALFTGTSVAQTTIDKAFTDVSQVITDSKISSTDLTTIAADQAAVKAAAPTIQAYSQTGTATATLATPVAGTVSSMSVKAGTISAAGVSSSATSQALTHTGRIFGSRVGHGRIHFAGRRGHR